MLGGVLGARLDYAMSARKKSGTDGMQIGAYAKAKAEAAIEGVKAGAGWEANVDTEYSQFFETSSVETRTTAVGGRVEYAQAVQSSFTADSYTAWIESIEGREIWSDYYPNSLYPIYELVGTNRWPEDGDELRLDLYNAYCGYFVGKKINVAASTQQNYFYYTIPEGVILGNAVKLGKGDGNIDSKNNKNTNWTVRVDLAQSGRNVDAVFTYTVKEGGGDNSELQLVKTVTIPVNKDIVRLDSPTTQTLTGVISKESHIYELGNPGVSGGNLVDLYVRVDGSGSDENNIGIKTGIYVYFTEMVN
jgi:hypothetical protein